MVPSAMSVRGGMGRRWTVPVGLFFSLWPATQEQEPTPADV